MKRKAAMVWMLAICGSLILAGGACKKKTAPVARGPLPAPSTASADRPPTGPAPTVEIGADPSSIQPGDATTLSWNSTHTSSLVIDSGVGTVAETGSLVVYPRTSTTYTATAAGPGGEARASTRVTVVADETAGRVISDDIRALRDLMAQGRIQDIFFAYDSSDLGDASRDILQENARWFRQHPGAGIIIEGHCDERGTEEYNLALGDRRAQSVKQFLVQLGVAGDRLETISLGEERPFAAGQTEAAYAQNRRAHFVIRE